MRRDQRTLCVSLSISARKESTVTADNVELFGITKALIGMVHVGALPGTPASSDQSIAEIADRTSVV